MLFRNSKAVKAQPQATINAKFTLLLLQSTAKVGNPTWCADSDSMKERQMPPTSVPWELRGTWRDLKDPSFRHGCQPRAATPMQNFHPIFKGLFRSTSHSVKIKRENRKEENNAPQDSAVTGEIGRNQKVTKTTKKSVIPHAGRNSPSV